MKYFLYLILAMLLAVSASAIIGGITLHTPDGTVGNSSFYLLNFSINGRNLTNITVTFNGTAFPIGVNRNVTTGTFAGNCTGTEPALNCIYNKSALGSGRQMVWNVSVNDSVTGGNGSISSSKTLIVDTTVGATYTSTPNWSISGSAATLTFQFTDFSPRNCSANVYTSEDSVYTRTIKIPGTLGTTTLAGATNCTVVVYGENVTGEGNFVLEYEEGDQSGAGVLTKVNITGIKTNLYTGWNLVTYPYLDSLNLSDYCRLFMYCTQIALRNNNNGTYFTFSMLTPSVGGTQTIPVATPVLVYVNNSDYAMQRDYLPAAGNNQINATVFNNTWNTLGLILDANMSAVLNAPNFNTSEKNITFASWMNQTKFVTCRASIILCTGSWSTDPTKISLYKGAGVWVLVENTVAKASYTINRSRISGD